MATKIDKEVLIKHHFWILAGVFLLMVLIPLFVLWSSVGTTIAKEAEELESSKKTVQGITNPRNPQHIAAITKRDEVIAARKNQVWKEAWDAQKDVFTFPEAQKAVFQNLYFGDPIDRFDADRFALETGYVSQLAEVVYTVQPILPGINDQGVVQFARHWNDILRLPTKFLSVPPTRDDIWLAQEDLWVKRELLRAVRDANDTLARFRDTTVPPAPPAPPKKEEKKDEKKEGDEAGADAEKKPAPKPAPKPVVAQGRGGDPNHRIYRNADWEVDIRLTKNKAGETVLVGKVKNIAKKRIPAGVDFKVFLTSSTGADAPSALVRFDREPMAIGEVADLPETKVKAQLAREGIFGLEQVLTWKTAPVKRIDQLVMGYPSARTIARTLKPPRWIAQATAAADGAGAATTDASPTANVGTPDGAGGPGGSGKFGGMMSQGALGGGDGGTTKNGMVINRYFDTNDQVRHFPVALVLVIDEENIPQVLSAVANSKLRVQITQCHWQHSRAKLTPPSADSPAASPGFSGAPRMAAGGPGGQFTGSSDGAGGPGGGMGRAGGGANQGQMSARFGSTVPGLGNLGKGMGTGSVANVSAVTPRFNLSTTSGLTGALEEEDDLNLVEISIYGIGALYEKFPPKPASATPAEGTTPTTTPAP